MKTKLVKSVMAPLVVACALVFMVASTASSQGTQGGRIQGTWEQITTVNDCAGHPIRSFPVMLTFHQGGTMMDGPAGAPPALRTPAQGVWRHTTDNTYAFRLKAFSFNAQNVFTGWSIIAGELTVDQSGNANSGPATVEVYDPNGVLLTTSCAETVGTRFEL